MQTEYRSRTDAASYIRPSSEQHRNALYCNRNVQFDCYVTCVAQLYSMICVVRDQQELLLLFLLRPAAIQPGRDKSKNDHPSAMHTPTSGRHAHTGGELVLRFKCSTCYCCTCVSQITQWQSENRNYNVAYTSWLLCPSMVFQYLSCRLPCTDSHNRTRP